jgi:serine/threonine protein phosphatase PrpC
VDVSGGVATGCAACGASLQPDDRFCERCGARIVADEEARGACRACGAPAGATDENGYCTVCGVRERAPAERSELDLLVAAAASDQGRVHRRNEDAFHLELVGERGVAAVVCDGISSSTSGDVAARSAAEAAGAVLARAIADDATESGQAMEAAIRAAHDAVEQVRWTARTDRGLPSCTLVSALVRDGELVLGSVGDSRAYWVEPDDSSQLTVDDSWAEEQVAEGMLTREQAARDPRYHSITHWVGADAPDRPPRIVEFAPERPGRLVLCSDGLWNYAPGAAELAALIDALPAGAAPAAVARALIDTALAKGGRDNITVVVIDVDPARPADEE